MNEFQRLNSMYKCFDNTTKAHENYQEPPAQVLSIRQNLDSELRARMFSYETPSSNQLIWRERALCRVLRDM